jgi:hypothetical protein
VSGVPPRLLDAVSDVLARYAAELGLDPGTVRRLASPAVTARTRDGALLRLDASVYVASELTR